jgi:hypothetical protein
LVLGGNGKGVCPPRTTRGWHPKKSPAEAGLVAQIWERKRLAGTLSGRPPGFSLTGANAITTKRTVTGKPTHRTARDPIGFYVGFPTLLKTQ